MNRGWQGLDELTNSFTARILSIDWELGWKEKKEKKKRKNKQFLACEIICYSSGGYSSSGVNFKHSLSFFVGSFLRARQLVAV